MNRSDNNRVRIVNNTIQERLIVPLWIRAIESQKELPLLFDKKACEICDAIDFSYAGTLAKPSELEVISHLSISRIFDETINRFIIANPNGKIVNLGCGMDTYYERAINNSLNWFELDLPEVMEFRKSLISETGNRKFIAGLFLDTNWFKQVNPDTKVLFIASRLFGYYDEKRIKDFIIRIVNNYPSAELLFYVVSVSGLILANRKFKKSEQDQALYSKWASKNKDVFLSWSNRISIKNCFPVYKHVNNCLGIKDRILASISDFFNCKYIVHIVVN